MSIVAASSRARALALVALALLVWPPSAAAQDWDIPFTRHELDNGLQVVLHEDHSDPVVAVYVVYHVGSSREELGRSGFAHLFEHLMFQGSENVGNDEHFKLVSEAGGTLNGTTNRDRTNYFETVPANQLELALWLEADRMGFLLPAITQENLDNQREVVKNERRQNYENRPYAQAGARIAAALYPAEHPYSWLTIGSHEDLSAASLDDVAAFFRRWYGPNNATLAIGGDIDPEHTLELVRRYFGPIPRGPHVADPAPRPVTLDQDVRLVMEDTVQQPQLSFTWPTIERGTDDALALGVLASVLSANKAAVLDKALTVDAQLASRVSAYHRAGDLAGEFSISLRAAPGVSLDTLEARLRELLAGLGRDGVDAEQLERVKSRAEASTLRGYETVARRTGALADANALRGDPASVVADIRGRQAVTVADVERVLARYLSGPAVIMSVVPEGGLDQAASGRTGDQIAAEAAFDRSRRPAPGPAGSFRAPSVWHDQLANGVRVLGSPYTELPLVSLSLSVPGGHLREELGQLGLSSLTAAMMNEGTRSLDTLAFTQRLDALGASLSVFSGDDELTVSLTTLRRHLDEAVALMGEVLLAPRFDPADFERLKARRLDGIDSRGDSIRTIAGNVWDRLQYADDSPAAWPSSGTRETVEALTLGDVKAFHARHVVPAGAVLTVVGDLDADAVRALFADLAEGWRGQALPPLEVPTRPLAEATRVYLVDKPGAPQSEIRIGMPSVPRTHPDYYALTVMNHPLGGNFSSRINLNLREDKGYTYGARSSFRGDARSGTFTASSGVRTDVTGASVEEFMKELRGARQGFSEEEAAFSRDALLRAMDRQFESMRSLSSMLGTIARDGLPDDYLAQRRRWLDEVDATTLTELARGALDLDGMSVLVVGDKTAVSDDLEALGYGPPIELDIDGDPVGEL